MKTCLYVEHLKDDESVVVEESSASDDSQVRKQTVQALKTRDSEKQQVVGNHCESRVAEATEVFSTRPEDEEDL